MQDLSCIKFSLTVIDINTRVTSYWPLDFHANIIHVAFVLFSTGLLSIWPYSGNWTTGLSKLQHSEWTYLSTCVLFGIILDFSGPCVVLKLF